MEYFMTGKELDKLSKISIEEVDKRTLVDIREVQIHSEKPIHQKMEDYLNQIKNPYCFLHGEHIVRVRFEESGEALEKKLKAFFLSLKKE